MPFVQRNEKGQVIMAFDQSIPGLATEELPIDHPDLGEEYMERRLQQSEEALRQHKEAEQEHEKIKSAVQSFNQGFSGLEIALSTLLYATIHAPAGQVAYAIYYSPTSFEARSEIVGNAVIQVCSENRELNDLLPLWTRIAKKIDRARRLRNAIAHSSHLTLAIRGKTYARLSPPAFDVIRIGRRVNNLEIPGLGSEEIKQGATKVATLIECVDHVNRLVHSFHTKDGTLSEKYSALRLGLEVLSNP